MFFNNFIKCSFLILCLVVKNIKSSEYFSSITGLESLLKTEEILLKDFREYVDKTKEKVDYLERELLKMEQQNKLAMDNTEDYLTNPINVYLLIKRLHSDWYSYQERIRNDYVGTKFLARLDEHKSKLDFPDAQDMYGASVALMRLQSTYKLDTDDVAAGVLNGVQYGTKMNWHDCYELGRQLYGTDGYNYTKMWLKESIRLLGNEKFAKEPISLDFMEIVAESLLQLGDLQTAYNVSLKVLKLDVERKRAFDVAFKAKNMLDNGEDITPYSYWQDKYHLTDEFKTYEKLCRAEIAPSPSQARDLRCRYETNDKPYRLLAPFKIEEHSLDPLVLTIHDILSAEKADIVKQHAIPRMKRSSVRAPDDSAYSTVRVSKNAWLEYETHPATLQMLRNLHDLTDLDMSLCEQLQVANYGLGGHYEPHWDFYLPEEMSLIPEGEGNRLATAIFYLSDVEQGGATVFPFLNITVWPQKGSVLFWYNLHRSTDRDFRTKHAGCPVLKGSKWIANVWINDITQTFTRPCSTQRDHEKSLEYEKLRY